MAEYTPIPTNNSKHSDDVDTSSSKKSIAALVVFSLCAGSIAVISNNNRSVFAAPTSLYKSACLQGAADNAVLGGFDMVAYFSLEEGASAVMGSADYSSTITDESGNAYTFYFSTEDNKLLFDGSPASYLPKYGGFCSWGIAEEDWWTKDNLGPFTNPNVWSIIDNELYLFMFTDPQARFLGELTADDLDSSGETVKYIADADTRWNEWFGTDYAFNTGCFNYDEVESDPTHEIHLTHDNNPVEPADRTD